MTLVAAMKMETKMGIHANPTNILLKAEVSLLFFLLMSWRRIKVVYNMDWEKKGRGEEERGVSGMFLLCLGGGEGSGWDGI